jgi:hypothetical protein
MFSPELAMYRIRGSLSTPRSSILAVLVLGGLLPGKESATGLGFCIANSKNPSLSERVELLEPSDLKFSNKPAI